MGDDIGWFNIGAYNQGMMLPTTPNLDKLAAQGATDTALEEELAEKHEYGGQRGRQDVQYPS
jgi:hypothetical protein